MDNAIKYCDNSGEISVSIRRGRRVVLTVENTYSAVGEIELNRFFDRFYRADKARKFTGGYGVGLCIHSPPQSLYYRKTKTATLLYQNCGFYLVEMRRIRTQACGMMRRLSKNTNTAGYSVTAAGGSSQSRADMLLRVQNFNSGESELRLASSAQAAYCAVEKGKKLCGLRAILTAPHLHHKKKRRLAEHGGYAFESAKF